MVAMVVAGMFSERWHTRAMTLASLWTLYLVSSWYDAGMFTVGMLEGNWGSLIWLGLTFFNRGGDLFDFDAREVGADGLIEKIMNTPVLDYFGISIGHRS